ncbi:MAG: hypothetical protein KAI70_02570 [Candidatus Omnitrophica bacterium]|nr:hypothetical protein [Candidatus Omnitrophota bacterium]
MEKVKCTGRGATGYTVSPESMKCEKGEDNNYSDRVVVVIRRMSERCSGGV